jgi:hypothetical protein
MQFRVNLSAGTNPKSQASNLTDTLAITAIDKNVDFGNFAAATITFINSSILSGAILVLCQHCVNRSRPFQAEPK